ncbi:LysR family transcriptional regulator [Bdellovibrio sp. HCB337]|uniref:LysR family transcriptional regulator n=1 Tax=Bdellovibrio sp. HCB337 TaxID=3394358 RepID=UPI0039A6B152
MIYFLDYDFFMTLDQIQVLQSILETGSFRAASQKLNRAQSAVSYAIRSLEDELGFSIFDRSGYRPRLTKEGTGFFKKAEELLGDYQSLQKTVQYLKRGHEPVIRLAISAHWPLPSLISGLRKLAAQFPQTEIKIISEVLSGEDLLLNEQVDLALSQVFQQRSGLSVRKVMEVVQVPVCASSHPLAKLKGKAPPDELAKHSQVVLRSTLDGPGKSAAILNPLNTVSVDNFLSKKELLRGGLGWGFMPEHLVTPEIKKKELVITHNDVQKIPLSLAVRQGQKLGPCSQLLWDHFSSGKVK